jgi:DnaK suppressor protein
MATAKTTKKAVQDLPSSPETAPKPKAPAKKEADNTPASPKTATKKTAEPKTPSDSAPAEKPEVTSAEPATVTSGTDGKWGEVRRILLEMKEQTLLEIKRSIKKGSETSVGDEPTGDIYDQASSERDRELGLILNDREREKVHSIDEALLRIAEGEYGICEECDEDIPMGRLKVLPFTRHCVKCKSDLEKFQAQTRRIEEDRAYREIPVGDDDEG